MKCRECDGAKRDKDNSATNDGVYIELFAIKNGIRYNAKITETDRHDELLNSSEKYKQLYETQFKKVLDYELHREES